MFQINVKWMCYCLLLYRFLRKQAGSNFFAVVCHFVCRNILSVLSSGFTQSWCRFSLCCNIVYQSWVTEFLARKWQSGRKTDLSDRLRQGRVRWRDTIFGKTNNGARLSANSSTGWSIIRSRSDAVAVHQSSLHDTVSSSTSSHAQRCADVCSPRRCQSSQPLPMTGQQRGDHHNYRTVIRSTLKQAVRTVFYKGSHSFTVNELYLLLLHNRRASPPVDWYSLGLPREELFQLSINTSAQLTHMRFKAFPSVLLSVLLRL